MCIRDSRPRARVDVIHGLAGSGQIERHGRELQRGPALHEEHFVIGRHAEQLAEVSFCLLGDADEFLAAMAHLHHGHPGAVPIENLAPGLLEDLDREDGGAGAEVVDTCHGSMTVSYTHLTLPTSDLV